MSTTALKLHNPPVGISQVAAQCTIVNLSVTREGLEEQLLSWVSGIERPDLLATAGEIVQSIGSLSGQLVKLEDDLLKRLEEAKGDILDDVELVEGLENTKHTASIVQERMTHAKVNSIPEGGSC